MADVVAGGHRGKGLRRALSIIDTSNGSPAVVFREDLGKLGWPLGEEVRQSLASQTERQERFQ
jgi:hypothetical protein